MDYIDEFNCDFYSEIIINCKDDYCFVIEVKSLFSKVVVIWIIVIVVGLFVIVLVFVFVFVCRRRILRIIYEDRSDMS